ncbi:MAG: Hpt domain-containing protein [Prosthecobacter sp.]
MLELEKLAVSDDQATQHRTAHSLRGRSSLFGLTSIHTPCREIEQNAENNHRAGSKPPLSCSPSMTIRTKSSRLRPHRRIHVRPRTKAVVIHLEHHA